MSYRNKESDIDFFDFAPSELEHATSGTQQLF